MGKRLLEALQPRKRWLREVGSPAQGQAAEGQRADRESPAQLGDCPWRALG